MGKERNKKMGEKLLKPYWERTEELSTGVWHAVWDFKNNKSFKNPSKGEKIARTLV